MKTNSVFLIMISLVLFSLTSGCCSLKRFPNPLPVQSDKILGERLNNYFISNLDVLEESTNSELYQYLNDLMDTIMNSGLIQNKSNFEWKISIIDDTVINAFACPGGYLFIYSGLLKFVESEDEFLGILGHEISHADLRHSTSRLIKVLGMELLSKLINGQATPSQIEQIAETLIILKFSRCDEQQADYFSVNYLCGTNYNAAGSAKFFHKLLDQPSPPEFLSTHPSNRHRIENINATKSELGCTGAETYENRYLQKTSGL